MRLPTSAFVSILLLVLVGAALPQGVAAHEAAPGSAPGVADNHAPAPDTGAAHEHAPLHFSHPLIAESPSPDTKLRFDYTYQREKGEEKAYRHTLRLVGEYAFRPWVSVEIAVPYASPAPSTTAPVPASMTAFLPV